MKKKIVSIVLILSMLVGMLAVMPISIGAEEPVAEPNLEKDGDVYLIKSIEDWEIFAGTKDAGWTGNFRLETDLNFTGIEYTPVRNFTGTFDGNGHTISGITYIDASGESGMFRCSGGEKVVKNFVLTTSTFQGKKWVGAVFCDTNNNTVISNVYVADSVSVYASDSVVGGFVGGLGTRGHKLTINNCVFAGSVITSGQYGGGFVGHVNSEKGKLRSVEINNCLMIGDVSTTKTSSMRTSGFFGYNYLKSTDVKDNTLTNVIRNSIYAGTGINNYSQFGDGDNVTIENCYTINGEGKMWCDDYNGGDHRLGDSGTNVTLIDGGVKALVGKNAVSITGWETRESDVMLPAGFDERFVLPGQYAPTESWTGTGTSADPYKISTAEQWRYFVEQSATTDFSGKYIVLGANITLNEGNAADWAAGYFKGNSIDSVCSFTSGKSFKGNFNGKGYTISGLYINSANKEAVGLFGEVGTATITNFRLVNSFVQGVEWMGAAVGETNGKGTVISDIYVGKDVYVNSTEYDGNAVGGVVGGVYGTNANSAANAIIIDNCVFAGTITGTSGYVAGILGTTNTKTCVNISDCLFLGSSTSNGIAAVAKKDDGVEVRLVTIERCVSLGTAKRAVNGATNDGVTITKCYTVGDELDTKYDVFGTDVAEDIMTALGDDWTVRTDDFITLDIFDDISNTTAWANEYEITSVEDWNYFVYLVQSGNTFENDTISLESDLDFGKGELRTLAPDGVATFEGTFDGQGHTIKRFVIESSADATSIFGDIRGGAVIKNLIVDSATVKASQWAGVVVGEVSGMATVENIYVTETVDFHSTLGDKQGNVGGIVGGLYCPSNEEAENIQLTVRNCVFAGRIYSDGGVAGGIVGRGNSYSVTIEDCLMLGSVEGTSDASGIIGWNKNEKDKTTATTVIRNTVYAGQGYTTYSFGTLANEVIVENCYSTDVKYAYCEANSQTVYRTVNHIERTDIINNQELLEALNAGRATDVWRNRGGDAMVPAAVVPDDAYLINVHAVNGASVRFSETSDIRFTGIVGSNYLEKWKTEGKTVTFGILITLASYVDELGSKDFTPANLDELTHSTNYVLIEAENYGGGEEAGYYVFSGVLWNLKSNTRDYAARTYVAITDDETGETEYKLSDYDGDNNDRSISYVAQAAYEDTCSFKNGYYKYELAEGQGVYSPYTAEQREQLLDLFGKVGALDVSFMSYNIRNVEDTSGWLDKATYEYTDRELYVRDYLVNCGADIIGLQEASWLKASRSTLDWFDTIGDEDTVAGLTAAGYTCVKGDDVNGGKVSDKKMYNPIYYKTADYTLETSGTKWLTSTPDVCSKIEGSDDTYKALNYVVLEHKVTGDRFIYVNVHLITKRDSQMVLDGDGNATSHYVQELQVIYLRAILEQLQSQYSDIPMFVGGDFNNSFSSINSWLKNSVVGENDWEINSDGVPSESIKLSTARGQAITKSDEMGTETETDSDFGVVASKGAVDLWWTSNLTNGIVHSYRIVDNKTSTTTGEKYPSDHLPVRMYVTIYKDNA